MDGKIGGVRGETATHKVGEGLSHRVSIERKRIIEEREACFKGKHEGSKKEPEVSPFVGDERGLDRLYYEQEV